MRFRLLTIGLLTGLVFSLSLSAADDKKDKKDNKDDPALAPLDSDKLPLGDYTGKLLTVPGLDGAFTLQIDTKHYVPKNPDQLSAKETQLQGQIQTSQQLIANLQAQVANSRTQREANQHNTQLQREMTHLQTLMSQAQVKPQDLKEVTDTKVYDMKATATADVRYINLPQVFDEDGKPKKYTAAELKELKGKKSNLVGYEAKVDDLKVGQVVKVTLARVYPPKPAAKDPPAKDDPNAKKDDAKKDDVKKDDVKKDDVKKDDVKKVDPKDPADKPPPEKTMQVKMIVILQDAPEDTSDPKDKKKKKDKN